MFCIIQQKQTLHEEEKCRNNQIEYTCINKSYLKVNNTAYIQAVH